MPCYVITHTRFNDMGEFRTFRARLAQMADARNLRLLPLRDAEALEAEARDQAVMLEFSDAEAACAFMCSADYRDIARPDAP
ncbi:DUF1330 domain-containing protein [Pseudooceanicola sp. LIPI14-2-Ac024]|uniref:DUF1330 domain-containing protein n=1 Tax=Pseudooceanicola sp. LIPI14-2-Ac024 TaxID=3344875 RepID=UPI0035D074E9